MGNNWVKNRKDKKDDSEIEKGEDTKIIQDQGDKNNKLVTEKSPDLEEDKHEKEDKDAKEVKEHEEEIVKGTKADQQTVEETSTIAHIEPHYFDGHDCTWKAEHNSRYHIKCGAFRKFVMYLTSPRSWDVRARDMYRSYAGLFAEVQRQFQFHPFVIHPFSRLRLGMEIFVIINYYICLINITLYSNEVVYNPFSEYNVMITEGFYNIFTISNFFTGYVAGVTDTYVILDLKKIAWNYLKSWFLVDLLYTCGMFIHHFKLVGDRSLTVDVAVFATKVLRLPTILSFSINVMNRLGFSEKFKTFVHILMVILNYLLWNVTFQISLELGFENAMFPTNPRACSWLTVANLWNGTDAELRAYTFNRAVAMLRRYSSLEIVEKGACVEVFYMTAWIIGWLVCFHCWAKFMILMIGEESAKARFVIMADQVKTYMNQRRYPDRIKQKALKYYAVRFHSIFFAEQKIMNCLSGQLREDIIMHINRKLVSEVEFLKKMPRSLLLSIGTKLKIVVFLAGDIIYKINTVADCIYFIDKGTVAIYSESGMEFCHLQDGDYFGEISLIVPPRFRASSVVAITNCELFRLDVKDFNETIARCPTLYEDMKQVALNRRERLKVVDEHHKAEWNATFENNQPDAYYNNTGSR